MDKPVSATPLRDEFDRIWQSTFGEDPGELEAVFDVFMAGAYSTLYSVPKAGSTLPEIMSCLAAARTELDAFMAAKRKKEVEQN